jgi:hypothetical protein
MTRAVNRKARAPRDGAGTEARPYKAADVAPLNAVTSRARESCGDCAEDRI